jgi:hypothetical protein
MRRDGPFQGCESVGVDERAFRRRLFLLETLRGSSAVSPQLRFTEWALKERVLRGLQS